MNEEKAAKEAAAEGKATAEGDLATTVKELKGAEEELSTANTNCMTTAADHEATVAARTEELKVIATAEKILKESTSGACVQISEEGPDTISNWGHIARFLRYPCRQVGDRVKNSAPPQEKWSCPGNSGGSIHVNQESGVCP